MMKEIIYEISLKNSRKSSLPFYLFNGKLIHIDTDIAIFQLPKNNALVIIPLYMINYMMPQSFSDKTELESKYKSLIHKE